MARFIYHLNNSEFVNSLFEQDAKRAEKAYLKALLKTLRDA